MHIERNVLQQEGSVDYKTDSPEYRLLAIKVYFEAPKDVVY